jgi:hypothetical protein
MRPRTCVYTWPGKFSHAAVSSLLLLRATECRPLIWAVSKCNRSEKKLRPQNKAQNRPAQRRLLNLKWFSVTAAAYVLHYAPGPSFCQKFLIDSSIKTFSKTPSKSLHEASRESHQSFVVASFAVLPNSAPKRESQLANLSDFGSRFRPRSARTDKLANTRGQRRHPPELRGRFMRCYIYLFSEA